MPAIQISTLIRKVLNSSAPKKGSDLGDLNIFPKDLILLIISQLNIRSKIQLSQTCKLANNIVKESPMQFDELLVYLKMRANNLSVKSVRNGLLSGCLNNIFDEIQFKTNTIAKHSSSFKEIMANETSKKSLLTIQRLEDLHKEDLDESKHLEIATKYIKELRFFHYSQQHPKSRSKKFFPFVKNKR